MPVLKKIFSAFRKLFRSKKKSSRRKQKNKRSASRRARAKRRSPGPLSRRQKTRKKAASVKARARKKASFAFKRPAPAVVPKPQEKPGELVGEVTHFFSRIQVVVVKIKRGTLSAGDKIRVRGASSDFVQSVGSMQIESVDVKSARSGQLIGLKVVKPARVGDKVYKFSTR